MKEQVCTHCKKEFEHPLELYNGTLACPICKEPLSDSEGFQITEENDELYRLSEIYYLRYISPQKGAIPAPVTAPPEELLKNAIHYCSLAAKTGNIKAIYKMGFYNEFYMTGEKSETVRARTAFKNYSSICSVRSEITETADFTNKDFQVLRRKAAQRIVALYQKFPKAFSDKKDATPPYTRDNLKKIVESCGVVFPVSGGKSTGATDTVSRAFNTLCSTFSAKRPPLFGMFLMSGAQALDLLKMKGKYGKRQYNVDVMREKLNFHYCPCNESGTKKAKENSCFSAIRSGIDVTDELSKVPYLYFLFFNESGKHEYLKKKQIKSVKEEILSDDSSIYRLISESSATEFLFFCDDIVFYKNAEELIGNVCGEG